MTIKIKVVPTKMGVCPLVTGEIGTKTLKMSYLKFKASKNKQKTTKVSLVEPIFSSKDDFNYWRGLI